MKDGKSRKEKEIIHYAIWHRVEGTIIRIHFDAKVMYCFGANKICCQQMKRHFNGDMPRQGTHNAFLARASTELFYHALLTSAAADTAMAPQPRRAVKRKAGFMA